MYQDKMTVILWMSNIIDHGMNVLLEQRDVASAQCSMDNKYKINVSYWIPSKTFKRVFLEMVIL